jgi:CheY-like chemotaxis protein
VSARRVLIVEDDAEQLELRKLILEQAGYSVSTAANAAEALERLPGCEIVVMDLCLPQASDGLRLIARIGGAARIVILSGRPIPEPLPVAAVLSKPGPSRLLLKTLADLAGPAPEE